MLISYGALLTMPLGSLFQRGTHRLLDALADRRHASKLKRHQRRLPPLRPIGRRVLDTVCEDGVAVLPLDELAIPGTDRFIPQADAIAERLEATRLDQHANEYGVGFRSAVPINPSVIAEEFPDLFLWGLDDAMLDLAENFIGLPVAYHGVTARKDLVDHQQRGSRKWHQDDEDRRVMRVLIYLSDVLDEGDGPFEYLPPDLGLSARSFRDAASAGMMTDEEVQRVVPTDQWRRVLGPKHTVILASTDRVFHRGRPPQRERKVLSYYYTSREPTNVKLCKQFSFQTGVPSLKSPLTTRQSECLWDYAALLPQRAGRPTAAV